MRKFGRKTDERRAFLKSLAANLILKEKIKTTQARAKELRSFVERLVSIAKKGNLDSQRSLAAILPPAARKKLIKEIIPRYGQKAGGYTRITKLVRRLSDGATMVYIEFIK